MGTPRQLAAAELAAIEKRRRELRDEKQTFDARKEEQYAAEQRRQSYRAIDQMDFTRGPPIQYKNTVPAVELSQQPLTPVPGAEGQAVGMGEGGPEEDPAVARRRREYEYLRLKAKAAAAQPATPQTAEQGDDINAAIDEAANAYPGGYAKWRADNGLGQLDPLAPKGSGRTLPARSADPFDNLPASPNGQYQRNEDGSYSAHEPAWNEVAADFLDKTVDGLFAPINNRPNAHTSYTEQVGSDPLKAFSKVWLESGPRGMAGATRLANDPAELVYQADPFHQVGRASNNLGWAVGDAMQGNWGDAGKRAADAVVEGGTGALGLFGLKAAPAQLKAGWTGLTDTVNRMLPGGDRKVVEGASAPLVDDGMATLAATLTDQPVRPQALDAIVRILKRSDVPMDRIERGLRRVVDVAKEPARRAATVAQLLQREFGEEFPKVVDNLHLVIRERGLSKKKGDGSATTVLNTTQAMRGSQTDFVRNSAVDNLDAGAREVLPEDFLASSARRNFGMTARERMPEGYLAQSADRNFGAGHRLATWDDAASNQRIIGEEGYEPILRTPIDDHLAERIIEVLHGPGMGELMSPLRQMAAGMGRDINTMIESDPLRAAHWVQHKARLRAEEATAKDNGSLATAYNDMRSRILNLIDPLSDPATPNYTYRHAREDFSDEVGRQMAGTFGNRFLTQAMDPLKAGQLRRTYADMTDAEKASALQSVRDTIKKQLAMQRPGAGPDAILSRPQILDELENVFGEPGKGFADDMRGYIAHDQAFRFGDSFLNRAADELGAGDMKRIYAAMSPAEKSIALQSVRDAVLRNINQSGANGNAILRRPAVLQQLEEVFGQPGAAFAGDVRRLMSHEQAFKFGDEFLFKAADDFQSGELKKAFEGFSEADKRSALQSTRDAVLRQLNMERPGGGAPLAILGRTGVLHQLGEIFGERGGALADDIRALVGDFDPATGQPVKAGHLGENQFLQATTNYRQSKTFDNLEAAKEGPALYGSDIANSVPATMAADGAMMASGLSSMPLLTTMRHGPQWAQKIFSPKTKTREDMTRVLMARQQTAGRGGNHPPTNAGPEGAGPNGDVDPGALAMFGDQPLVSPEERQAILDQTLFDDPGDTPKPAHFGEPASAPAPRFGKRNSSDAGGGSAAPAPRFGKRNSRDTGNGPAQAGVFPTPVGFPGGKASKTGTNPAKVDFDPGDLVLARNDMDGTYADTGIALGMDPDDPKITATINSLVVRTRKAIENAKQYSTGLQDLAKQWNVSVDELEKFLVRQQKNPNTGRVEAALSKAADIIEKADKLGEPLTLQTVVERLRAAGHELTQGSLEALMSKARNGTPNGHAISEQMQARIQNLPKLARKEYERADRSGVVAGHAVQAGLTGGSGVAGWFGASDTDGDGEISDQERMLSAGGSMMATGTLTGLIRSKMMGGGKPAFRKPNEASFGSLPRQLDDPRLDELGQSFVDDASTAKLRKIQQDAVAAKKVPPVFKTFKLPDGKVIAWDGAQFSHSDVRDMLDLGDTPAQHGQFKWNDDLDKTNWYEWSGDANKRPRPLEAMVNRGLKEGRSLTDIIMDSTPDEGARDLRAIGAIGPDKGVSSYPHRRKLAMSDVQPAGRSSTVWLAPNGTSAEVRFGWGDEPTVNFYLGGRQTRDGGVLQGQDGKFVRDLNAGETKQTFEKAFAVLEREVIRRNKDAYHFTGASDAHNRLYLGSLQRIGAPQGYVAMVDTQNDFFALIKQPLFEQLVAERRIDPSRVTVIPSKRGGKEVPEWRRDTGRFALPLVGAGGGAALFGAQGSDESASH